MLGSLTVDRPQHSNGAGGGLLRRDLQQAINDSVVARAVAALGRRGAAIVGLIALLASAAQAASPAPPKLRMGTMTLSRCTGLPAPPAAYCGHLDRPLDPAGSLDGRLSIYFEFYPHRGPGKAVGMLVATEGGPGYPATQSRSEYLALFDPLRRTRDILIMDNRGTGKSGALDCPELQAAERWTTAMVGACGVALGDRAAFFGTALAADDLAAILSQLGVAKIDLYGDSYGTYFEQVFALRHPALLRSVVLDGAYPLNGPDYAWYPSYAPAMRDKFDLACRRSPSCAAIPGSSIEHLLPVLAQLRRQPSSAVAIDADGKQRQFSVDPTHLATVMFGSAPPLATVRELDAAARAYLEGDRAPLLRLMAETVGSVDSEDARNSAADVTQWSAALEVAVMCHDPPQIFDMRLPPALRAADRDRALAERRRSYPDTYAPFTIDEYRGMPLDYSFIDQCVAWPVAPAGQPAGRPAPPAAAYPDVPALVISGELDNMTTPADGAAVAAAFRRGKQMLISNSFHVNALPHARSGCAADIARHFIVTLEPGDSSCAATVPPVRLVPRFAVHADGLDPAIPGAANAASVIALKLASATVQTVGDILVRAAGNSSGHGAGLRGGTFALAGAGDARRITLDGARWTEDLAVSGTIDQMRDPAGTVRAQVTIQGPEAVQGSVELQWEDRRPAAQARIQGEIGGQVVEAHMPAP
jgi:pimeloyl-ACP methyl ester carboxylesterase